MMRPIDQDPLAIKSAKETSPKWKDGSLELISLAHQYSSDTAFSPLFPSLVFHQDPLVVVGSTPYPTTSGHVIVHCREDRALMALEIAKFTNVMLTAREVACTLSSFWHTQRCGLTYDGGSAISVVPLHGLNKDWKPILHEEEIYYAEFPGYITSKSGPKMADTFLDQTRDRVAAVSGITQSFNTRFEGEASDENLFARIVRGELPQWRIWEDDSHIAFLTPFGNTAGFAVVVPRKHLSSNIFALAEDEYIQIVQAAYAVAQHLKKAFDVEHCGMFFEGYEIDYAHVKLVPIHRRPSTTTSAEFQETYQGFLTTQFGPLALDLDSIAAQTEALRELHARTVRSTARAKQNSE